MSILCQDIIGFLEQWAPLELAEKWDNCGLQLGDPTQPIRSVAISLDIDRHCLDYVAKHQPDLVITHHPLLFRAPKSLDSRHYLGKSLSTLIQHHCQVYTMHTNLDAARDGVNDCLASAFGLDPLEGKSFRGPIGRWFGLNSAWTPSDFRHKIEGRFAGAAPPEKITKIGFCGGSGKSLLEECLALQLDIFITGELSYHDEVACEVMGLPVYLVGHLESETPVLAKIQEKLSQQFPTLDVSVLIP